MNADMTATSFAFIQSRQTNQLVQMGRSIDPKGTFDTLRGIEDATKKPLLFNDGRKYEGR
jgi:hypothetical protein